MRWMFLVMTPLAICGCASIDRMHAQEDLKTTNAICDRAYADVRLASIRGLIPLNPSTATVAQLSDRSQFTEEQKQALMDMDAALAPCTYAEQQWAAKYDVPAAGGIHQSYAQNGKMLRALAIRKNMTIGEFNEARADLLSRALSDLSSARAQYSQQRAYETAANAAAWSQISNSLQQMQQTQIMRQQQLQMNRPVQTTCSRVGYQVNCTSY